MPQPLLPPQLYHKLVDKAGMHEQNLGRLPRQHISKLEVLRLSKYLNP
jgi:hypothetical protein